MADFPERTVTAQTSMAEYERAMRIEKLRKKFGNNLWNVSALRGRGWANTSAAKQWKSAINSGGSSLTGLSTRLKMMADADKEFVGNQLTGNFQNWLTENPDATIGSFNTWANEQGPWYEAERRARDQKVVKDRLDAMKNTKVGEAVDTLFGEYNDEWLTADYAEQNQVRQNIADSDAIKNLPSKWRQLAVNEVIKSLNAFLTPTGQYAKEVEARKVAGEARNVAGEDAKVLARRRLREADLDTMTEQQFLRQAIDEIEGTVGGVPFADREPRAVEDVRREYAAMLARAGVDSTNFMQSLDEAYGTRAQEIAREKPPGTKKAYDASTGETIFATDAEIAANDDLVPEESNLEKDYAQVGREMVANGDMLPEVWETYRMGGMDKLDKSITGPDKDVILLWINEVKKRRARAATPASINFQMATGTSGGQTDDGIGAVRLKKKESDQ